MKRPALLAAILLGRLSTGLVIKSSRYPRYNLWSTNMASTGSHSTESPSAIHPGSDAEAMPGASTLFAHLDYVSKWDLVLASQSPRRREIVELMGFGDGARVVVSTFEENLDKTSFSDPRDYAIANAEGKAREVAGRVLPAQPSGEGEMSAPLVVIGSDTIVDLDGRILEKPSDDEHAFSMLSSLSGRRHLVHSGVSLFTSRVGKEYAAVSFCETTEVLFTTLSAQEIRAYIRTREPMDKSGSYGIQGAGGQFVRRIEGCYFNVMGFPIHAFSRHMAALIEQGKA